MAERARHAPNVGTAGVWLLSGALLAGCDGDFVNLGTTERTLSGGDAGAGAVNLAGSAGSAGAQGGSAAQEWRVDPISVVLQQEGVTLANPTLLGDLSELYYTAQKNTDPPRLKVATPLGAGFGNAKPVELGASGNMLDVASPAVSVDGNELWLSLSNAAGNTDVFRCTHVDGAWSDPTLVSELSSPDADDAPRPPSADGLIMPLSSKRHGGRLHQIYLVQRPNRQAAWGEPSQDLLGNVNLPEVLSADGFLSDDGKTLYFASTRDSADADLYVARRASITASFGDPEPLPDLHSDDNERMPWVSPRGDVMYFVSDRPTAAFERQYALYRATKL